MTVNDKDKMVVQSKNPHSSRASTVTDVDALIPPEMTETIAYLQRTTGYEPHSVDELIKLRELLAANKKQQQRPRGLSSRSPGRSRSRFDSEEDESDMASVTASIASSSAKELVSVYTFNVPKDATPGQVVKVSDPTRNTILSVKMEMDGEGMEPGAEVTFAPKGNDTTVLYDEGRKTTAAIEDHERKYQERLELMHQDVKDGDEPWLSFFPDEQRKLLTAAQRTGIERQTLHVAVQGLRDGPQRAGAAGAGVCAKHHNRDKVLQEWLDSMDQWHRLVDSEGGGGDDPGSGGWWGEGDFTPIEGSLLRPSDGLRTLPGAGLETDVVRALGHAARQSFKSARHQLFAETSNDELCGKVDSFHLWPAEAGGASWGVKAFCAEIFTRIHQTLGLTAEYLAGETDLHAGFRRCGDHYQLGAARRFCFRRIGAEEADGIVHMLPAYADYLQHTPHTLLPHWAGLFQVVPPKPQPLCPEP